MPTRLDWRVGPGHDEPVVADPSPTVLPGRRIRWPATALLAFLYAGALLAAAFFGYELGRWQEAGEANLDGLRNQLAVEDLAWQQGDRSLYLSTLDPTATALPEWLYAFDGLAPAAIRHEVVSLTLVPPDRAQVRVRIVPPEAAPTWPQDPREEDRAYRLVGRSWLRTGGP